MGQIEDNWCSAMADEKDTFSLLAMPYQAFKFAPMYYRSGFILKASPETGVPKVQKIVVTAKDVPPEDIPYLEGLLKLVNSQLLFSQNQLDDFWTNLKPMIGCRILSIITYPF